MLRAELNSLQQQAMSGPVSGVNPMNYPPDHMHVMEKELANLKSQLEVHCLFILPHKKKKVHCLFMFSGFSLNALFYLLYHFKITANDPVEATRKTAVSGGASAHICTNFSKAGFGREACCYVQ